MLVIFKMFICTFSGFSDFQICFPCSQPLRIAASYNRSLKSGISININSRYEHTIRFYIQAYPNKKNGYYRPNSKFIENQLVYFLIFFSKCDFIDIVIIILREHG